MASTDDGIGDPVRLAGARGSEVRVEPLAGATHGRHPRRAPRVNGQRADVGVPDVVGGEDRASRSTRSGDGAGGRRWRGRHRHQAGSQEHAPRPGHPAMVQHLDPTWDAGGRGLVSRQRLNADQRTCDPLAASGHGVGKRGKGGGAARRTGRDVTHGDGNDRGEPTGSAASATALSRANVARMARRNCHRRPIRRLPAAKYQGAQT